MPPDEFWTELCDSLNAFCDNILKKSCAGGCPAAKNLSCKFVTQTASVPNPPVVPYPYQHQRRRAPADAAAAVPAPPPAPAAESAAPPEKPALPTPPANKGRRGNRIGGRAGRG